MTDLALDERGDVIIENDDIITVTGDSLIAQQVRSVLRTNLQEWFFDWDQGIDFGNLLGKGVNEELVRFEIERGLAQVDAALTITDFALTVDSARRLAKVRFTARTESGEEIGGEYTWD